LRSNSNPVYGSFAARNKGSAINGKFFGPNANNCTMSNITGCIFLPAGGWRDTNGTLQDFNAGEGSYEAFYWTSTNYATDNAYLFYFDDDMAASTCNTSCGAAGTTGGYKAQGFNVRCVQ
jgi:hypothetical protein